MKEIELFYLPNCPYCKNALKAIEELQAKDPRFRDILITRIDESKEPVKAESRDYWYVPSFFYNGNKLYECQPDQDYDTIKENVQTVFTTVLEK